MGSPAAEVAKGVTQAGILWLAGFREACSLHRAVVFCSRSRLLLIRTGQCFLLNGLIFLGRYNDIAKHAYEVLESKRTSHRESHHKDDLTNIKGSDHSTVPGGFEGVCLGIGEQLYSILLLTFFFMEVFVMGFIPVFGKAINFLLLSWMYSYYCFEYKWNHSEVSLNRRLDFFQSNWAFFAGFGSPCVLAIFFFSPLVSYGVMAILYPLFVLAAAGCREEQVIDSISKSWGGSGLRKIPLFHFANKLSMLIVQLLPKAKDN